MHIGDAQAAMAQIDKDRLEDARKHEDCERAANNDDRQRALGLRADAGRKSGRQEAERIDEIGHHRRTQPPIRAHDDSLDKRMALVP